MTPDPVTVDSTELVVPALSRMREVGSRHLPVVHDGVLVGIVSSKDFSQRGEQVMHIMTPNPHTVRSDSPLDVAASLMAHKRVSCLPVVDDGKLVGIVTTYDMLDALASWVRNRG